MSARCLAPVSMDELFSALSQMTDKSKVIGGGTDLIIRINEGKLNVDALLYMGGIKELTQIEKKGNIIDIGACATMSQIAKYFDGCGKLGALSDAAADVGSAQIRNNGTIGGNIANASPAGDMLPVLFMMNAQITVASCGGLYTKPIKEILLGQAKTSLSYNEAIVKVTIEIPESDGFKSAFVKLGSRKAVTISRIGIAVGLYRDDSGIITSAQMVAGAVSLVPIHIEACEQYLIGRTVDDETVEHTANLFSKLIMEILKGRKSMEYKAGASRGVVTDVFEKLNIK